MGGTFFTAQFRSSFEQGEAEETFTWRKAGDTLRLYHYNIQSNAFFK